MDTMQLPSGHESCLRDEELGTNSVVNQPSVLLKNDAQPEHAVGHLLET